MNDDTVMENIRYLVGKTMQLLLIVSSDANKLSDIHISTNEEDQKVWHSIKSEFKKNPLRDHEVSDVQNWAWETVHYDYAALRFGSGIRVIFGSLFRRYLISRVRCVGDPMIEFENKFRSTDYKEELLRNRLKTVPFVTNSMFENGQDQNEELLFECSNPASATSNLDVYSHDAISPVNPYSATSAVPNIFICTLKPGQEIRTRLHVKRNASSRNPAQFPVSRVFTTEMDVENSEWKTLCVETNGQISAAAAIQHAFTMLFSDLQRAVCMSGYD